MEFGRLALALTVVAVILAPQTAPAATMMAAQNQVMATVHQFIDGINKNDVKSAVAACAPMSSVIDEFPPHEWQGSTGCADWAHAFVAYNKTEGITDGIATLAPPSRVQIDGTTAYVVAPASYAYKQHGKPITESGATFTLALRRIGGSWRITGWAWAAH